MAIKNLWTLTVDEALVVDKFKDTFKKSEHEVFLPANAQLKDIDLIFLNLKRTKAQTIQVKGSRTYEPKKNEVEKFGEGSGAWIVLSPETVFNPQNHIDFFIFVLHSFADNTTRKEIKIDYLIIPSKDMMKICKKKKERQGGKYHFFIWIDNKNKRSFEFNNRGGKTIPLSKYLDNWKFLG
ncbi:hypothetical protein KJ765_00850 [Candidatus Micrarchaeota archaeon]|nr:hypothetical protein [Candidatus Micrarchaeota archaeon]